MSTLLRSLKFIRKLNIGKSGADRRLGLLPHRLNSETLSRTNSQVKCLATHSANRNYVTDAAVKQNNFVSSEKQDNVDDKLDEIDRKIKSYKHIYKKDVEELIEIITKKGSITNTQALLLIRCCGEFLFNESCNTRQILIKNIWNIIKELDVELDVSHYNALLLVNLENEIDFSPLDILLEMKENNIEPNRVTFQRLIEQYCNKGDIAGATKILEHMSNQELPINENIFNSLIKGHSQAEDLTSAIKLLDAMRNVGIEPSSLTYSSILCAHAKRGNIEAIRSAINECTTKNILLSNKDILEVIYVLAINGHSEYITELITHLAKGVTYNKDCVSYIYKLIEKNCEVAAYTLLKTLIQPKITIGQIESGRFFIKKMITSNLNVNKIIEYCKLMKEDNINPNALQIALYHAFTNKLYHFAFPLMKAIKNSGEEIREQYFYPIFVSFSKANNLQGLLDTLRTMIFDYEINPQIMTLKDYVIPYMVEDSINNLTTLMKYNLPYSLGANAILLYLLENNKTHAAKKFVFNTKMVFRIKLITNPLVNAFLKTKDVTSFIDIIHHQYIYLSERNDVEKDENSMSAKQFTSILLEKTIKELSPQKDNALVNSILQSFLEKGLRIDDESANKVKEFFGENIESEIKSILSQITSEELIFKPFKIESNKFLKADQENLRLLEKKSENSLEYKMLLLKEQAKKLNKEAVHNLMIEIEKENPTYTLGVCAIMLDYYSKIENINEADKWWQKINEIDPDCKLDKMKILHYAEELIKNNRSSDAMKVLDHSIPDEHVEKNEASARLIEKVCKYCPNETEAFLNKLKENKYFHNINVNIIGPVIKVLLDGGDIEKAIEKFKWACDTYKVVPQRKRLMKELIKTENASALHHVTDLTTQVVGEIQALHDLAISFFECDRPRQARKILETSGLRLSVQRILKSAERYSQEGNTKKLENLIQLFSGLYMNLDPLYILLLNTYESKGEWEKCLSLWTQLQEENIQPSTIFMKNLERILSNYDQNVPFAKIEQVNDKNIEDALMLKDINSVEEIIQKIPDYKKYDHLVKSIEAFVNVNDFEKAFKYIDEIVKYDKINSEFVLIITNFVQKLLKSDEFSKITKLSEKLGSISKKKNRNFSFSYIVNERYYESGNFMTFITYLDEALDDAVIDKKIVQYLFNTTITLRAIQEQLEVEEKIKKLAFKAYDKGVYGPINTIWINEFLKGSPEEDKIWNEYISNIKPIYLSNLIYKLQNEKSWNKFPKVAEKINQANMIPEIIKKRTFYLLLNILLNADDSKKYELAFECLQQAVKVVRIDQIDQKILNEIEKNLTSGQTIESLRTESESKQEKAVG